MPPDRGRLLAVSHPSVVALNQEIYRELAERGWGVTIVVPSRWRHEYSRKPIIPRALPGSAAALRRLRVLSAGHPNGHVYLARPRAICSREAPDVAFIECEPYSLAALQWSRAFTRLGIPFGVQHADNSSRPRPAPVRRARASVLHRAAFVAARSLTAARLARRWGAGGEVGLVPHAVPAWTALPPAETRQFTVGFAGRLVESKGLGDLLDAVRRLQAPVELLLIGDGPMRRRLDGQAVPGSRVRVLGDVTHERMPEAYAQLDVLVLPSRTEPRGQEQFGRVIPEALSCGIPVVGSDSGEIPWLIEQTGGGLIFPERDSGALADRLQTLRGSPSLRSELASAGRASVQRLFSVTAAADRLERLLCASAERSAAAQTGRRGSA